MRESRITVAAVGFVVLALLAYLFVFQVRRTEVAVHYRAGKVLRVLNANPVERDESGWRFRLPPPLDKVVKFDRRIRVLDGQLTETQLQDDWQIVISMYAAWRISDPVALTAKLKTESDKTQEIVDEAASVIKEIIQNEASKVIGKRRFDDLVNTDKSKLKFDEITSEISGGVRDALAAEKYGLALAGFGIRQIAIPEDTTEKVFERMNKERETVAAKYIAAGDQEKTRIIEEARAQAEAILAEAQAEAINIRRAAEESEAAYYDIFAQYPELAIFLRRLEALRTIADQARASGSPITFVLTPDTYAVSLLREGPDGGKEED